MGSLLIPTVRQHRHHTLVIGFGYEHIDIEMALPLISFLRQNVPRMRMATLDFSRGCQPHSLGCTFVRFKFWHELTSLLY
jgi:isocitrate dehydrogenase kinase/phosphatase